MHFKHPEILWFLLLLIIPIIIHLFQFKRFSKVYFTNVKFLKKIELQSRKSSTLKKWLILVTRLLSFAALIFAFSQPYTAAGNVEEQQEMIVYIDNSYSMQAKGSNGELLRNAVQTLIDHPNFDNQIITVITNGLSWSNMTSSELKKRLIDLQYDPKPIDYSKVTLRFADENINKTNALSNNVLISDLQNNNSENENVFTNVNTPITVVKLNPVQQKNIFVDSVYFSNQNAQEFELQVLVKSTKKISDNTSVSLFNNEKLIGKSIARFNDSDNVQLTFKIQASNNIMGKIAIVDDALNFDNDFYFVYDSASKTDLLIIGNEADYLKKIFTAEAFNLSFSDPSNVQLFNLQQNQLIILNELDEIPVEWIPALQSFYNNNGKIVCIPSKNADVSSYNKVFTALNLGRISERINEERLITTIHYNHPLMNGVFESKTVNFQYPMTDHSFSWFGSKNPILSFDNNSPFLSSNSDGTGEFYFFSAALNLENSNFTDAALIVPVFYNFAKNQYRFNKLYERIDSENELFVDVNTLRNDEVLKVQGNSNTFIPLQTARSASIVIRSNDHIDKSGFYTIIHNDSILKTVAYNYQKSESILNYYDEDLLTQQNLRYVTDFSAVLDEIYEDQKINALFKWFLAISILFLLCEMLILKYFKI